jgi:murein L,D-transpeptidase YcbB/YkuD
VNKANQHAAALNQTRQGNNVPGQKTITTRDGQAHPGNWARNNPINKNRFDQNTQNRLRNWDGKKSTWAEVRNQNGGAHPHQHHAPDLDPVWRHRHHDRDWWHHHCAAIIFADSGWWGWDDGWWYPAWGYDSYDSNYPYDGPVYGFGGLPPDEVIANVQSELQRLRYYSSSVDGIFGPLTRQALRRYQKDKGLEVTGVIDPATAGALGWSQ